MKDSKDVRTVVGIRSQSGSRIGHPTLRQGDRKPTVFDDRWARDTIS
jgi:hypothetical protein